MVSGYGCFPRGNAKYLPFHHSHRSGDDERQERKYNQNGLTLLRSELIFVSGDKSTGAFLFPSVPWGWPWPCSSLSSFLQDRFPWRQPFPLVGLFLRLWSLSACACLCWSPLEPMLGAWGAGHRKVMSSRMRQPWGIGRFSCINIEWSKNNERKPSRWWCYRLQRVTHQLLCPTSLQRAGEWSWKFHITPCYIGKGR